MANPWGWGDYEGEMEAVGYHYPGPWGLGPSHIPSHLTNPASSPTAEKMVAFSRNSSGLCSVLTPSAPPHPPSLVRSLTVLSPQPLLSSLFVLSDFSCAQVVSILNTLKVSFAKLHALFRPHLLDLSAVGFPHPYPPHHPRPPLSTLPRHLGPPHVFLTFLSGHSFSGSAKCSTAYLPGAIRMMTTRTPIQGPLPWGISSPSLP